MSGTYTIPIFGLKEGRHTIDYTIGEEFFEFFEESEIKEGSLIANIEIEKRSTHADLLIKISGSIKISCDRCLEIYDQHLSSENRILIKFGKSLEEDDPDIISLSSEEHEVDLRQHLYEFIHLALPIRRVHPNDSKGKSSCDPLMLKKLKEHLIEEEHEMDPRWAELKKLMNDN